VRKKKKKKKKKKRKKKKKEKEKESERYIYFSNKLWSYFKWECLGINSFILRLCNSSY
jgi:hypothetical protein